MPNPPVNGVLLRRRAQRQGQSGDYYLINEDWYDPATRTASEYDIGPSLNGLLYSRPAFYIVDRFCLLPGVSPFTERRYSHEYLANQTVGTGDVIFVDVPNAPLCVITCTLALTVTASAMANGRADITVTPAGGVGGIEISLDNFLTAGRPATNGTSIILRDYQPGTYTVSARETRPGGCQATGTVTLVSVYGPRFQLNYKAADGAAWEMLIHQREYAGAVEVLPFAQKAPVLLDWPTSGGHVFDSLLRGSEAQLALYLTRPDQLLPLFSGDERLHRVDVRRAGLLNWTGYLLPEQYDVAFLAPPTTFGLRATDGLGTLSDVPFAGRRGEPQTGDWSLLRILRFCLDKLDLALPLYTLVNLLPDTAPAGSAALEETFFDVAGFRDNKGKPKTCGRVLADILAHESARIQQENGAWWVERLSELTTGPATYAAYSPAGTRLPDFVRPSRLVSITPPTGTGPSWRQSAQRQNLRPAVARIAASITADTLSNALRDVLPTNADLPAVLPRNWSARGPNATPTWNLVYAGRNDTPIIRLIGNINNANTPAQGTYIETPLLAPRPSGGQRPGADPLRANSGAVVLTFTATPYGNTPAVPPAGTRLFLAVQQGQHWMQLSGEGRRADNSIAPLLLNSANPQDSPNPIEYYVALADTKPVVIRVYLAGGSSQIGPQPIRVRFYAPVGGTNGGQPITLDITNLKLEYYGNDGAIDGILAPATEYVHDTGQLVSRTDEANELFFSTTAGQRFTERRTGTLLDREALPVAGFIEPITPGQFRDAGDYFIRDRALLEARPAQVLTGPLAGPGLAPGCLLTDPAETRPGVYALTACTHDTAAATWQITAVQLNTLTAPFTAAAPFPDNAIYYDDLAAWQDEDDKILVYENA